MSTNVLQSSNESAESSESFQAKTFEQVLDRLNHASITKRYAAYEDIAWDSDEFRICDTDVRWELPEYDVLGGTEWYRTLPQSVRIRLALDRTAERARIGVIFESTLIRGMLEFATFLPTRSPEFRYALHECIEETQHSLMFQEFVNRSGYDPGIVSGTMEFLSRYIIKLGKKFPELFFIFVLGGEAPIDCEQRQQLKKQTTLHPLMKRMVQIHITEEARHICFANEYLREHVPKLRRLKLFKLRLMTPLILGSMGKLFLMPPASIVKRYNIPDAVILDAYERNPRQKHELQQAMAPVSALCKELGILTKMTQSLWRKCSLIP